MCNYFLVKKKIGDTNSVHARLKEVTDNSYWISPLLQAFKLQLLIGYSQQK